MHTRIKTLLAALLALAAALALTACQPSGAVQEAAYTLGLDLSAGWVASSADTHGGFQGDGIEYVEVAFSDNALLDQLEQSAVWMPLPLPEPLYIIAYGAHTQDGFAGPYLCRPDSGGEPLLPFIDNGYYYFEDRHAQSTAAYDANDVLDRASFNFTLAIYDADAKTLYYCKYDT